MSRLINPIIPGGYPDPSICSKDGDFYLVNSSFAYFPGLPIWHSRDLAHWEQIGNVLDRPSQLPLDPWEISGGLAAPTIRYHEGLFYVICTNINHGGNFIVTARAPCGPWSEPHWLEGAYGIDPSLFWDDDGKAWYTGSPDPRFKQKSDRQMIWLSEIDLNNYCLVGEKYEIWGGALEEVFCPEAPHIYRKDGYYYLMIAEGGTEHYHSETIARSKTITGPYEGCPGNPILTQRHLGTHADIANTGHGDLIELPDGSWYIVFLGSRPYGGYHKNMGRETFIAPVIWEDGWPVVSPGTGRILFEYPAPALEVFQPACLPEKDDFDGDKLAFCWNILGTPDEKAYRIENGCLKIRFDEKSLGQGIVKPGRSNPLSSKHEPQSIVFIGRRQQHKSFHAEAELTDFHPENQQTAGLAILQNDYYQIRLEAGRTQPGNETKGASETTEIRAYRCYRDLDTCLQRKENTAPFTEELLGSIPWNEPDAVLIMDANEQVYRLTAVDRSGSAHIIADHIDARFMGSECAGGCVGAYIGMFASGNGQSYDDYASFSSFTYKPL